MSIESCHRARVKAIVCAILPKLGAICVRCSNAKESEEGNGQWKFNGHEDPEGPFVRPVTPREKHVGVVGCESRLSHSSIDMGYDAWIRVAH